MKIIYAIVVLFFLLISCREVTTDYPFIEPEPHSPLTADEFRSLAVTHVMSYEEALKEVNDFMSGLSPTRGDATRTISEVRVVRNPVKVRSAAAEDIHLVDTALYIFNFAGDQGFAIVSADSRSEGLLAFAESGHFSDIIDNPGFAVFYSRIEDYQLEAARKDKALKDSLYEQAKEKMERLDPETRNNVTETLFFGLWTLAEKIELPLTTKWHQYYPFNMHIPYKNGNSCLAGCTPVAVAQVVAYHKYPVVYKNHVYNWDNPTYDDKGELLYQLGKMMGTDWGNSVSNTDDSKIPGAFRALGYRNVGTERIYSEEFVRNSLAMKWPCIIGGYAKKTLFTKSGGHSWIIDGYIRHHRFRGYYMDGLPLKEKRHFLRCNYGWGGKSDGYYLSEVFDTNKGPVNPTTDTEDLYVDQNVPFSTKGTDGFYQYAITIFPNINPYY